jgi:flagellar assembly factor FliW
VAHAVLNVKVTDDHMKCADSTVAETRDTKATQEQAEANKGVIHFPNGLLGFEEIKKYVLLGSSEEAPFLWLQMVEDPKLAFLVISPACVLGAYEPNLSPEDVEYLGLQNPQDALVFNIVTTHKDGTSTVNLKGPIVVNRYTLVGKQVIPVNSAEFSLHHSLPVAST